MLFIFLRKIYMPVKFKFVFCNDLKKTAKNKYFLLDNLSLLDNKIFVACLIT